MDKKYTIMKTTILLRVIVLVAMVFTGITNVDLKAQGNNKYVTNEEKVGEFVVSKTIYREDGSLYRYMKYDFTYDNQKRMTSKEAFKWDEIRERWMPSFKLTFTYSDDEVTLVYGRWNSSHKAYDNSVEKSIYKINDENIPVAYVNYKMDGSKWVKDEANDSTMNIKNQQVNTADFTQIIK